MSGFKQSSRKSLSQLWASRKTSKAPPPPFQPIPPLAEGAPHPTEDLTSIAPTQQDRLDQPGDPERKDGLSSGASASSSAIASEFQAPVSDLWARAEKELTSDKSKAKVYQAYLELLDKLDNAQSGRTAIDRQDRLRSLLDAKAKELNERKLHVRIGKEHDMELRELFLSISKKVLAVRDLVNGAASASPPAALACAGTMLFLLLLSHATEQRRILLKGLNGVASSISRFSAFECVYRPRIRIPSIDPPTALKLQEQLEASLTKLHGLILEFHARSLCFLYKHRVVRFLNDVFSGNCWETLLQDIQASEAQCMSFKDLIDGEKLHNGLEGQQRQMDQLHGAMIQLSNHEAELKDTKAERIFRQCLGKLHVCPYLDRKNRNRARVPGTCEWFTNHVLFQKWKQSRESSILVVSADPGCGKSVLARYLVDDVLHNNDDETVLCYFFFKDDFADQRSVTHAVCSFLRQLIQQNPSLMDEALIQTLLTDSERVCQSFSDLGQTFKGMLEAQTKSKIICLIDAFDECQTGDRRQLVEAIRGLLRCPNSTIKFLITSRPYDHILRMFRSLSRDVPVVRLNGEEEIEVEKIACEIKLVI